MKPLTERAREALNAINGLRLDNPFQKELCEAVLWAERIINSHSQVDNLYSVHDWLSKFATEKEGENG